MQHNTSALSSREVVKGYHARFVHTERMTLAFWEVEAGAEMPVHHHFHEQVMHVLEGNFELTVSGEKRLYQPGLVAVIPPNAPHGGVAITACRLLDIFSPVREDYQ